ncbi:ammonium transporter [Sulfurospirillum multivorans]|uniref:Ammonium transporter n=2 Tax=Sulfurospirillum multivorans TaxID=66821 RepID=A0AA86AMR5_SULMK|nr:ammonium transporter [Sulfurospirillum multivorans]AHJ13389.1 ammonia channel [Sulfurospirillum multivorans DSM 12446]QEH06880.1 ammonia channel [Sulfurospirillum multivorans]
MRSKLLSLATLLPLSTLWAAEEAAAEVAEAAPTLDVGNTAWVLTATALVMFMTPAGLALFYGGMSRSKNLLNTIAMSVMGYIVASIVWVIAGYTLAFGTDIGGIIGFDSLFLSGIKVTDLWATGNIPVLLFVAFQMTFAGITVSLASGAVIERLKFSTWLIFAALWILAVYAPVAHWVWGGGFLSKLGVLDFAGGTVVHINAGVAGLVIALMLGKRADYGKAMFPSSVTLTVLGASMLWFGWFGFNAGSELGADGIAASAFLVTNTAAAIAALSWMTIEYITYKKFTLLGIASGIVAGLVAITPAAGFVDTGASLIIGAVAGIVAFYGVNGLKKALKYDDSLDAFGIHGVAGIWGALATGIFANPEVNELGTGLLYGNADQVMIQIEGIIVTIVYTAIATAIVFKIASILTGGARVSADAESQGLDEVEHGEKAFNLR